MTERYSGTRWHSKQGRSMLMPKEPWAKRDSSHVMVLPCKFRCRRARVLRVGITKMLYYKNSQIIIIKDVLCQVRTVFLLYYNGPCYTYELVKQILNLEKVTVFPHPPYSPDLTPCDYFLLSELKKILNWLSLQVPISTWLSH